MGDVTNRLDLTDAELQVLGAMPFDPSRINARALEAITRLQDVGLIATDRESGALCITAAGRAARRGGTSR